MLAEIIPYLRCPSCFSTPMSATGEGVLCAACGSHHPLNDGILDMAGDNSNEVITPFQRVMQSPAVVSVYERYWRRLGYYLASSRSFDEEIATILKMNRERDSVRVLDLACGPGVFTRPLAAQSNGIVVGLDLSRPMLRRAQRLLGRAGIRNVALIRASASRLPFVDGTFSYVNCCGALHLFDRPGDALREISRVLINGGHLAVQTTIRPARSAGFAFLLERFIRFGFFDEIELAEEVRRTGFNIVASERHRISYTFLGRHIS